MPIYYESRLAKLTLNESQRPLIDPRFEEVTEGEEIERKEQIKTKWAQLEALVGTQGAAEADCPRHHSALWAAPRSPRRQGYGCLHEPPHLH